MLSYTLCEGKDPTKVKYDVSLMRTHLLHCVQKQEFTAFPSTGSMYNPAKPLSATSFRIYSVYQIGEIRWCVAMNVKSGSILCVWTWM